TPLLSVPLTRYWPVEVSCACWHAGGRLCSCQILVASLANGGPPATRRGWNPRTGKRVAGGSPHLSQCFLPLRRIVIRSQIAESSPLRQTSHPIARAISVAIIAIRPCHK